MIVLLGTSRRGRVSMVVRASSLLTFLVRIALWGWRGSLLCRLPPPLRWCRRRRKLRRLRRLRAGNVGRRGPPMVLARRRRWPRIIGGLTPSRFPLASLPSSAGRTLPRPRSRPPHLLRRRRRPRACLRGLLVLLRGPVRTGRRSDGRSRFRRPRPSRAQMCCRPKRLSRGALLVGITETSVTCSVTRPFQSAGDVADVERTCGCRRGLLSPSRPKRRPPPAPW